MIGNLDHKQKEIEILFLDCLRSYHNPQKFLTYLHSLIQSMRNFTFAVQSNKKRIKDFDTWYSKWQERMKTDDYMRWLNSTRTEVVHEDIIAAESYAKITLRVDYSQLFRTESYNYRTTTSELMSSTKKLVKEFPEFTHSVCTIERNYLIMVVGQKIEVMALLGSIVSFLMALAEDLDRFIGGGDVIKGQIPKLDTMKFLYDDHRCITFKIKDGEVLAVKEAEFKLSDLTKKEIRQVSKRYKTLPKINTKMQNSVEYARSLFNYATKVFLIDGYHLPMLHVKSGDKWGLLFLEPPRDRSEKILHFVRIAEYVEENKIETVIFIFESWMAKDTKKAIEKIRSGKEIGDLRKKEEALMLFYADKTGKLMQILSFIKRDKDGNPILGEAKETDVSPEHMGIMSPILAKWGLVKTKTIKKKVGTDAGKKEKEL